MDELEFRKWMGQMANAEASVLSSEAGAVWWRAQLRKKLEAERRALWPIQLVESATGISCWLLTAGISREIGVGALAGFLALSVATVGALGALAVKKL